MLKDFNKDAIITLDHSVSYREMLQRISLFSIHIPSSSSEEASMPVEQRRKVIIFSENREGYVYAFFSVWLNRGIAIPVDAMASVQELAYLISDCQPVAIWASKSREQAVRDALAEAGIDAKVLLIDDYEREAIPAETPLAKIDYEMDHTAIIIYTSGTTGNPKGVMLSFCNLLTNLRAVSEEVPILRPSRRVLTLLPLHHVLPLQGTMLVPLIIGAGIAISPSMAADDLMQTLQVGKVGAIVGVPRLWQTLYKGIKKKIDASFVTRSLYNLCKTANSPWLSRTVFKKVHQMLGGHLEACVSGGAALDPSLWKGMHVLGIDLIEGYGMTECAPIIAFSRPDDLRPGCVGQSLPSCQVEIKDGEICAKGANVMQGYYKRHDATAEIIDADGWLHSGDLGYMDEQGHVFITGRKKEMIVLSNGKNINPEELEQHLQEDTLRVKEAAVVEADNVLKAIICPQAKWAKDKSMAQIEEELKREVVDKVNSEVASYKTIQGIFVYNGELPRTRLDKLQRFKLAAVVETCKSNKDNTRTFVAEQPTTEEFVLIHQYIQKEKKADALAEDNLVTDLGFDSLDMVEFECFLDQTFGIEMTQKEILSCPNIGKLAEYIRQNKTRVMMEDINWRQLILSDKRQIHIPEMSASGWWIVKGLKAMTKSYFSMRQTGMEHIPQTGNFIMVANHQSYLDVLFLTQGMPKEQFLNTRFFAKEEHVSSGFNKRFAASHGVIVLKKAKMKDSILNLGQALRAGHNLVIFPEGTRTLDGHLNEFRPTFAILSMTLGIPVVPVCIKGAFEAMPKHQKMPKRSHVSVEYLPILHPADFKSETDMTEAVRQIIQLHL